MLTHSPTSDLWSRRAITIAFIEMPMMGMTMRTAMMGMMLRPDRVASGGLE